MRLIDADALMRKLTVSPCGTRYREYDCDNFPTTLTLAEVKKMVRNEPTVAKDNNVLCKQPDRCGCGGKAILTDYTVEGAAKQYSVACETCFMGLPYGFDTPDDAWAAWRRAMGGPQPDLITGLSPCDFCTDTFDQKPLLQENKYKPYTCMMSTISIEENNGKHQIEIDLWDGGNVYAAFEINYCPMCGRKLTAPPRPGAIGPDAGEMAPNGDEGAGE